METKKPIRIMLSGLPGKMISEVAKAAVESEDIELDINALGLESGFVDYPPAPISKPQIRIIGKDRHDDFLSGSKGAEAIIVDFTWPDTVNSNAELYCKYGVPFVMGTTMKPEIKSNIEDIVAKSGTSALIAPNMAKQIVAVQWAMEEFAAKNEGLLEGYELKVVESHQHGKKDTSGTARAMVKYFNQLGIPFDVSQIEMIRDPAEQIDMGVPEQYLKGHGWHTYTITPKLLFLFNNSMKEALVLANPEPYFPTKMAAFEDMERGHGKVGIDRKIYNAQMFESADKTLFFMFAACEEDNSVVITHNINGRRPYALGALDAVRYLTGKIAEGSKGQVYSMIDVLKGK